MKKIKKLGTFEENMKWMDDIEKFNKKSTLIKGLGWFEDPVLGECNIEKTLKERLLESIDQETDNFENTELDKNKLIQISERLVDYVLDVDRNQIRTDSAAKSLENELYNII